MTLTLRAFFRNVVYIMTNRQLFKMLLNIYFFISIFIKISYISMSADYIYMQILTISVFCVEWQKNLLKTTRNLF